MRLTQLLLDRMCMKVLQSYIIYYVLLLAKSPLPFSICSLEKAVSLHQLCPLGVVNRSSLVLSVLRGPHFILWIRVRHGCVL